MNTATETRVAIALIGAMSAQTIAALLWAGGAAERLTQLESRLDRAQDISERVARLEEQGSYIRTTLIRIEKKIDDAHEAKR